MTTKRAAPVRRGSDRRRRSGGPTRATARRPAEVMPSNRARPQHTKGASPSRDLPRSGPQTATQSRPVPAKNASQAKARAKARKAKAPRVVRPPLRDRLRERLVNRLAAIDLRPRTLLAKVPFVVLVIGSLGVGLGLTLWLSTDSAERSYQLGNAREENRVLLQHKESLERGVLEAQAAPALADAARNLGMIPTGDTAHLVQDPTGNWVVVGSPRPAEGVPPPSLNTKLPDEQPGSSVASSANPVEVPVRSQPGGSMPAVPGAPPEVLLRAPDGSSTVGAEHLPGAGMPSGSFPGMPPGEVIPQPGQLPPPVGPVPDASQAAGTPGAAQ